MSANLHALLIAADRYLPNELPEGSYPSLHGCVPDVALVETFLRSRLGLSDDRLIKLTSTNTGSAEPPEPKSQWPTYENIVGAFRELGRRAKSADHIYIHYSGHGGRVQPTLLPDIKGEQAYDESLVPIDIGTSTARYVRDIELAKLLQELVGLGLVVTVVLDCCHSGGATRGVNDIPRGIDAVPRGVEFIANRPLPDRSDVGSLGELRAAWLGAVGDRAARSLTAATAPTPYVLLAACRPNEKANEFPFDGSKSNGALTYWMLETLRPVDQELTFKMLYDRILAKVHAQFPSQTPMLLGNAGRAVFGDVEVRPTFTTLVLSAEADGKRLTLATGLAAGMNEGAEFAVYPRTAADLSRDETRKALVRLTRVRDADADAEVVQQFGEQRVEAGDQTVLLAVAVTLRRRVRFVDREGKPAPANDPALLPIRQALAGNGWVEIAEGAEGSDFAVRVSDDGRHYAICSADGAVLQLRPDLPVGGSSPAQVVQRLIHLAKYRAWLDLENKAPNATLQKRLQVEVLAMPKGFDPTRQPWPRGEPFTDPVPEVSAGDYIALRITNRASQAINASVLDLQADWGMTVAYPTPPQEWEEVDESGGVLVVALQASLPADYNEGTDTLKVIAAYNPVSLRALELPPLDKPLPADRGTRAVTADPLARLLAAIDASAQPRRGFATVALPGREWAAVQVAVRISKPKGPG